MKNIVFVGAGSMAEAIISGICSQQIQDTTAVFVMNKTDHERIAYLQRTYGVLPVSRERQELLKADLVVLAVKPKDAIEAMQDIASHLSAHTAVLSVLAGISISVIEHTLGKRAIARSMPNTSAAIKKSATGIAWNNYVTDEQKTQILSMLHSFGSVAEVEEDLLHTVTALSGSGPAYIYYFAEALEHAAVQAGLDPKIARKLIIQTIEGAALMMRESGSEPAVLRSNVTSPGGTTEAGILALAGADFQKAIHLCIEQAERRSRELGRT